VKTRPGTDGKFPCFLRARLEHTRCDYTPAEQTSGGDIAPDVLHLLTYAPASFPEMTTAELTTMPSIFHCRVITNVQKARGTNVGPHGRLIIKFEFPYVGTHLIKTVTKAARLRRPHAKTKVNETQNDK